MESEEKKSNTSRLRWLKRLLVVLVAVPVVLLMLLDAVLSDFVLQKVVDKLVPQYVDGNLDIGRIKVSAIRNFPHFRVELHDVDLTYPHARFEAYQDDPEVLASMGIGHADSLSFADDTLAHADLLMAAVNVVDLIKGEYTLPIIGIKGLRAYAHRYDSTAVNWDMFLFESDTTESSTPLPEINLGKVLVDGSPMAVYTDRVAGIYARLGFDELSLLGRFDAELMDKLYTIGSRPEKDRLHLDLANLLVEARLVDVQKRNVVDSVALELSDLCLHEHQNHIDVEMESEASYKMYGYDLIHAPLALDTEIGFPPVKDGGIVSLDVLEFNARIAAMLMELSGKADIYGDHIDMDLAADVKECSIGEIINDYLVPFVPALEGLKTDADIKLEVQANGTYGFEDGRMPTVNGVLTVPDAHFAYSDLVKDSEFDMTFKALFNDGHLLADLEDFCFDMDGLSLTVKGKSEDALADDPRVAVDGSAHAALDKLMAYLPADLGIVADGDVDLVLGGAFRPSQLSLYKISSSELKAALSGDLVKFAMPADTLYANLGRPVVRLENGRYSAAMDTLSFTLGEALRAQGAKLRAQAVNSSDTLSNGFPQVDIALDANSVDMQSGDDLEVMVRGSRNRFSMKKGSGSTPVLKANTAENALILNMGENRVLLRNAALDLNTRSAAIRRNNTPRDSTRRRQNAVETESDFKLKDIDIKLDSSLFDMYRKYNPYGSLKVASAKIVTPMLPLRTSADSLDLDFTDNVLTLNSLGVAAGTSSLSAKGSLRGLRQAFQGRGRMNLDMDIESPRLNVNELLAAFEIAAVDTIEHVIIEDNREYQNSIVVDTLENAVVGLDMPLIVVPSNLNASVRVKAGEVNVSNFVLDGLASDITMRDRTVQLLNTLVMSDVGNAQFDAFYSTRTKKDIKAGFNLALSDVTADKVIELFPVVDSLVPMLKSFKGLLNLEMAATSPLDTNMNLVLPSIDGMVKLDGKDLLLEDTGSLRRIAQLLMFKDARAGHIKDMTLYGIISNNKLQIYPFLLGVDRYTLALYGQQKFDSNFDYHISIVDAPLPFRFGLNLLGNFDNWNYSIGRARYRNRKLPQVLPLVESIQNNLSSSIRDIFNVGVDQVMRGNESVRREAQRRGEALREEEEDELLDSEELAELDSMMLDFEVAQEQEALEAEIESLLSGFELDI